MAGKLNPKKDKGNKAPAAPDSAAPAAGKPEEEKFDWLKVSDEDAKAAAGKAWGDLQSALEMVKVRRAAFYKSFTDEARKRGSLAEGKMFRFTTRFGLAVAIVDDDGSEPGEVRKEKVFKL